MKTKEFITFTTHTQTWNRHKPGDPIPCDREEKVTVLYDDPVEAFSGEPITALCFDWKNISGKCPIIGWRAADTPKEEGITEEQIRGWMQRHDWPGNLSAARSAIEDAQSLHLA